MLLELAERLDGDALAELLQGVEGLRAWLAAPPASATPEGLLLAVRLWARLPADVVAACPLLPAGAPPPPASLFTAPSAAAGAAAAPAAAGVLGSRPHLEALVPVLRETSRAHPRLHSVWPTLLALLIPGFNPDKVGTRSRHMSLLACRSGYLLLHVVERPGSALSSCVLKLAAPCPRARPARSPQEQRQSESGQNAAPRPAELEALWGVVVERELFTSSHERKYLGFMLFAILLPHLT